VGGEALGGHAGQARGHRRAPPRGRPTGGHGRPGDAEGVADARAQGAGRDWQVGLGGGEKKGNGSTCKLKNMHFPGSKIHQIFTEAILNHQNTMQPLELKNLLWIAHKNSNNIAVFNIFKNFIARIKHPKIK
jgi:hypothetical protein